MPSPTPRQRWSDAVWESDLRSLERLVALAFAKHAGRGVEDVWVSWSELRRLTRLSNDAATRALKTLRDRGWLVKTADAAGPKAARYRLGLPESTPLDGALDDATERTADRDSTPSHDESTPPDRAPSTPRDGAEPQRNHEETRTSLPDDGRAALVVLPGGRTDREPRGDGLPALLATALSVWKSMMATGDPITFEAILASLSAFLLWTTNDLPPDEQADADDAAHAAFTLARELGLDTSLSRLDRHRLSDRMRAIPAGQRLAVVLSASEDAAPPDVRTPVAFLLRRIERSDPKYNHPDERTAP